MDRNDQQAIESLFQKLAAVERQGVPRDPEAEGFIEDMIRRLPGAPYHMAQTIVAQEQALEAARRRIEALEAQTAGSGRASGGLLDSFLGGGRQGGAARGSVPRVGRGPDLASTAPARPASPWGGSSLGGGPAQGGAPPARGGYGGGGFLAGAAQTAVGVAGGVLLGNMLAGMFDGGGEAQAAEAADAADANSDPGADEAGMDQGGFDGGDAGFDAGDFGGEF